VVSYVYDLASRFHGGNTGSNAVGDAKSLNNLQGLKFWRATVIHSQSGIAPRIQRIADVKDNEFEGDEQAQKAMKGCSSFRVTL
jgi:hypothetical protein